MAAVRAPGTQRKQQYIKTWRLGFFRLAILNMNCYNG